MTSRSPSLPRYLSPLRYPGGKGRMGPYLADLMASQYGLLEVEIWAEPFAGGLGAGLHVLAADVAEEVWFCETNPALAALWRMIRTDLDDLARRIELTNPTIDLFYASREMVKNAATTGGHDDQELAVAALILNRCSRSGIVAPNVGPIGGKDQAGKYTVKSRFDPAKVAARLRALSPYTQRLRQYDCSGIEFLRGLDGGVGIEEEMLAFVDPPYTDVGNDLYGRGMSVAEHRELAWILNTSPMRWALTYDATPHIWTDWYPNRAVMEYGISHSAHKQHADTEYLIVSDNLILDPIRAPLSTGSATWLHWFAELSEPEQFTLPSFT